MIKTGSKNSNIGRWAFEPSTEHHSRNQLTCTMDMKTLVGSQMEPVGDEQNLQHKSLLELEHLQRRGQLTLGVLQKEN